MRQICCETGFFGAPVEPLFGDREVFADFFTRYYTDWEPESCMVAETDGRIVGYLTGCLRYYRYAFVQLLLFIGVILPKVAGHALLLRYGRQDFRFLRWFVVRAFSETPRRPPRAGHFHINLLPRWRTGHAARRLIFSFLDRAPRRRVRGVYGQIQTFDDQRRSGLFERYGFKLLDRRKVTKFQALERKNVYVSTYFRLL